MQTYNSINMNTTLSLLLYMDPKLCYYYTIISIFYTVVAVLSATLNLLVGVAIVKNPSLWKPSIFLLSNLVVTDFLSGIIAYPFMAIVNVTLETKVGVFRNIFIVVRKLFYYFGVVSMTNIAAIAIDRLLAIRLKMNYHSFVTKRRIVFILFLMWFSLVIGIVFRNYVFKNCSNKIDIDAWFVILGGGTLLTITTTSYALAFYSLRKISSRIRQQPSSSSLQAASQSTTNFNLASYRKSFFTMLTICIVLITSYLPYLCFVAASRFILDDTSPSIQRGLYVSFTFSEVIIAYNSVINPVLYLLRMNDVRCAVKKILKSLWRRLRSSESENSPDNEQ